MQSSTVVRRYARALFQLAKEQNKIQDLEREVEFLSELFHDVALHAFLENPNVASREKKDMLLGKIGPHISQLTQNFVALLFDRRREHVLQGIAQAYHTMAQEFLGQADGVVESAKPLTEDARMNLEASLSKSLGVKVRLSAQINPKLLGGLRITVGHRRMDSSVIAQMQQLRKHLLTLPLAVTTK